MSPGRAGAAYAAQEGLPPPVASAEEIRDAAREILSRPEFREPSKSLYQRLQEKLAEWLGEVFGTLVGGGPPAFLAWVVLVAALGAAAYLVLRGLQLDRRRRGGSAEEQAVVQRRRPAADWDAEAAAFEARGEWRGAVRCRYRALIARLARQGVVDEVAGRTAGEYRAAVDQVAPAAAPAFTGATTLFERAWYGNAPTGAEEATAFRELAERVLESVDR
ncbi:MAG: DUF4129 domain-containing protein [Actinobacteria bacterium]|nr:DUF4129 domain-containing protein [Actinomycetota bacterium]